MTNNLADRCEAASGADRELDATIWRATVPDAKHWPDSAAMKFTASIDAALTLVPEGYDWSLFSDGQAVVICHGVPNSGATGIAATPALALCAAALRAIFHD